MAALSSLMSNYLCSSGPLFSFSANRITVLRSHSAPPPLCRPTTQAALAGCLPPDVLHQQAPLDRLEESPDGSHVTLHFKGDRPPVTALLVVGADGGQSTVRSQVIGDGPPLFLGEWP